MRSVVAAILLISVVGCSAPSYSLRSSSATLLAAVEDPTPPPQVRRGHSAMWKTGAIITFTSMLVTLAGAGMIIGSLGNRFENGTGYDNFALFLTGTLSSAIGYGGMFIGGPITWISGIGRDPDASR
ncbi:MAG: hypothetical protein ACXVCV_04710 [Polyangia bacterium]